MFFCSSSYSKECEYEEQKIPLSENINIDCQEVNDILDQVRIQVQAAQTFFQFIGAKDARLTEAEAVSQGYKEDSIFPRVLKLFSENARVQITNKDWETPKESLIEVYLKDLANLSNKYETVTLDYDKNFKFIFKPRPDGTVDVDMVTFQGFEGCISKESNCYEDITRKVFHVSGTLPIDKGKIKIHGITADETVSHRNFTNKNSNLLQQNKTYP
jgi:hypothetical protein